MMKYSRKNPLRKSALAALTGLAAASALVLAACGSPAGADGGNAEAGQGVDTEPMRVALITHSTPGDTFWDILRQGAEAAAAKDNVELLYTSDPDGARQAQLVETAIDQDVDGIVVTLAKADAMHSAVEKAVDAGIPVFSINAGEAQYKDMGALAHFGQDEKVAGRAAGEKLNELDAQRIICVIQEQGHVGLENRCAGVGETFEGQSEILYVQAADVTNIASNITSKLQTNSDIDFVLTLGAPQAPIALDSVEDAGSDAQVATFDMNDEVLAALQDGSIQFAVDQQPYLQGYGAVEGVWLYNTGARVFGGGQPVLTGPQIVSADQTDVLEKYADSNF